MFEWLHAQYRAMEEYQWAYHLIIAFALLLLVLLSYWLTKALLNHFLNGILRFRQEGGKQEEKLGSKIIPQISCVVPAIILAGGISVIPGIPNSVIVIVHNVCQALVILAVALAIIQTVDIIDIVYHRKPVAHSKPLKGYLLLLKVLVYTIAGILIIATLINRNPLILLSGLGAMMAVLMLIFQDTILSVVASVQLSSNNMIRVGDWIEMPSQNADGDVIEIALYTVKVQNWDKTISTIPTRKLITDSFKNWRGMSESGGRRIKRSLGIDQRSVRFLNADEIKRLKEFVLLDGYLETKDQELSEWNSKLREKGASPINERQITNLGTFRAYVHQYLRNHPKINQDMTLLVRQLQPGTAGIPLEIYCFSNDIRWVQYESIQADIFDHLLAILPFFDLRVFQQISDTSGIIHPMPALLNREENGK